LEKMTQEELNSPLILAAGKVDFIQTPGRQIQCFNL